MLSPVAKVRAPDTEEAVGEGAEGDTPEAGLRVATAQTLQGPGKRMESGFRRPLQSFAELDVVLHTDPP